ncbi:hypothetical protein GCM10027418_10660 [Mariniluteicoccus endophyticus]
MGPTQGLVWKIYTGVLGAVTTIAAQKIVTKGWELATGEEPPEPGDPDTPLTAALSWALASAIGVGVVQLMTNRFTARRFRANFVEGEPNPRPIKLKI